MKFKISAAVFLTVMSLFSASCTTSPTVTSPSSTTKTTPLLEKKIGKIKKKGLHSLPTKTKTISRINTSKKIVYLTFDDGPSPYTLKYAEILKRKDATGTFFALGSMAKTWSGTFRKLTKYDVSIQVHSWNHDHYTSESNSFIEKDISKTLKIFNGVGVYPHCFRPPYGQINDRTKKAILKIGLKNILWNVDTEDWEKPGVSKIYKAAINGVRPGAIILLHDGGGNRSQTLRALPKIIDALKSRGYSFGKLCED